MRSKLLLAAALTVSASAAVAAEDPGSRPSRDYVQMATESDTFEIMESTTALAQSADPGIRAFAQQMIAEHGRTSAQLGDTAARSGLKPPPPHLSNDQSQFLAALQSLRGAEFDRAYARQQVMGHHAALVTQQGYAQNGDTPALKQLARSTVPLITQHLQMAEQLQARLGGS